jgi:PAS domain S-box-containing protein
MSNRTTSNWQTETTGRLTSSPVLGSFDVPILPDDEGSYHTLVQSTVHGFLRTNAQGRLLEVNPALVAMLGYQSEQELVGLELMADVFVYPIDAVSTLDAMRTQGALNGVELQWKKKDSKFLTVRISGRRVLRGVREECEFITEDVTRLRALEQELRQAQKMEALGRLAGCVAHDFNNLLGIILGYCELVEEKLEASGPLSRPVCEIKRAGQRAASLTEQLLAFSRAQVITTSFLDLNIVVNDVMNLLYRVAGEDVEILTSLATDLEFVNADRGQLGQAVIHLAIHARDSMPAGGGLTLVTKMKEVDSLYALEHTPMKEGRYVSLEISDTGHGLSPESQARVFEPFFNSRHLGSGRGLGLAAVYGIVKQNGGFIWVESKEGVGSTFEILLPSVGPEKPPLREVERERHTPTDSETVLVVEEVPALRDLIVGFLKESGYVVLSARDGEHALYLSLSHKDPIHLLLTDIVMPGIGGPQLAQILAASRPTLQVLYMSGYTEDGGLRAELNDSNISFVRKPFSRQNLIHRVRQVLHGSS